MGQCQPVPSADLAHGYGDDGAGADGRIAVPIRAQHLPGYCKEYPGLVAHSAQHLMEQIIDNFDSLRPAVERVVASALPLPLEASFLPSNPLVEVAGSCFQDE